MWRAGGRSPARHLSLLLVGILLVLPGQGSLGLNSSDRLAVSGTGRIWSDTVPLEHASFVFDINQNQTDEVTSQALAQTVPAKPFFGLQPGNAGNSQLAAIDCLTAAVYYEAANEPITGQRAVAQVVLNRVRHPAFPNTVCGVVFEGSERTTGCQFTFTCDGSLRRSPSPAGWLRGRAVAIAALSGYVERSVGHATHYHADYVVPYWAQSLAKLGPVASHVFYQWKGTSGTPVAFSSRYLGAEFMPSTATKALSSDLLSYAAVPTGADFPAQQVAADQQMSPPDPSRGQPQAFAVNQAPSASELGRGEQILSLPGVRLSDAKPSSRLIEDKTALIE